MLFTKPLAFWTADVGCKLNSFVHRGMFLERALEVQAERPEMKNVPHSGLHSVDWKLNKWLE